MLDRLMDLLNFAYRQKEVVYKPIEILSSAFENGFQPKRILAFIIALFEVIPGILEVPRTPLGQELNLDGYNLVFCDEFEGDSLDTEAWSYIPWNSRGGIINESQVSVKNGNLIITGEYLDDGNEGPGWYCGDIVLNRKYKRGYFEIKCICNDGGDFWSAFWIQADSPYDHDISRGGVGGAELDIFEAMSADEGPLMRNGITQTIHCNGYDDDPVNIDSRCLGFFKGKNIYEKYNTYGLEWTEDEYIFYVNGIETARSSFANGVSQVEETVRVSMCAPQEFTQSKDSKVTFTVDYVKIWQK